MAKRLPPGEGFRSVYRDYSYANACEDTVRCCPPETDPWEVLGRVFLQAKS